MFLACVMCVCVRVCVCGDDGEGRAGEWEGRGEGKRGGGAENWCYQYLTNPSSIFMADNRGDQQLSRVSGRVFITD